MLTSSCGKRRCAQSMDRYQNADERVTTDGNLGKLECDGSGVADDPFRRKHPRAKGLQLLGQFCRPTSRYLWKERICRCQQVNLIPQPVEYLAQDQLRPCVDVNESLRHAKL